MPHELIMGTFNGKIKCEVYFIDYSFVTMQTMETAQTIPTTQKRTAIRWQVCALLFVATTLVYLTRQTLSVLKPELMKKENLNFGEADYSWVVFSFQVAYGFCFVFAGRFVDRVGAKIGLAVGVFVWSISAAAGGLVRSWKALAVTQFFMGAGQSLNFPASLRTVAEWYPQRERALATGIFNSGSNVGAMLGFAAVYMASWWGWQFSFFVAGGVGVFWLVAWKYLYKPMASHPGVNEAEREYILGGRAAPIARKHLHWTTLLRFRQAWSFLIGKFLTDPVWWFYLYYLPGYLVSSFHMTPKEMAKWLIIPYVAADVGSVFGGWISGALMRRGWNLGPARYAAMAICAFAMPGAIVAGYTTHFWLAITLVSLACASHQGWSANLFTTATDLFPTEVAGSITGLGGLFGAIGGMLMPLIVGTVLDRFKVYAPMFIWAGLMHPLAWFLFLFFAGTSMKKADFSEDVTSKPSIPLLISGSVISLVGIVAITLVLRFWEFLKNPTTHAASAPAAGVVAASGIVVIGLALLYAGKARRIAVANQL